MSKQPSKPVKQSSKSASKQPVKPVENQNTKTEAKQPEKNEAKNEAKNQIQKEPQNNKTNNSKSNNSKNNNNKNNVRPRNVETEGNIKSKNKNESARRRSTIFEEKNRIIMTDDTYEMRNRNGRKSLITKEDLDKITCLRKEKCIF